MLLHLILQSIFELSFYFCDLRLQGFHLLLLNDFMLAKVESIEVLSYLTIKLNRQSNINKGLVEKGNHGIQNYEVVYYAFIMKLLHAHLVQMLDSESNHYANDKGFNI